MQPGESVAKALRRLGGAQKKMTSAQRLKAKKQGIKPTEEELEKQKLFQSLTSLADRLIQSGAISDYFSPFRSLFIIPVGTKLVLDLNFEPCVIYGRC